MFIGVQLPADRTADLRRRDHERYADTASRAITTYYYVVTAVDASGNESFSSAQASATTLSSAGTMHVHQISNGAQKGQNSGRWIDIYISNHAGVAVANATVTGTASGFDNHDRPDHHRDQIRRDRTATAKSAWSPPSTPARLREQRGARDVDL